MKTINIRQKLDEIECPVSSLVLGDFDIIGEYTSKKFRNKNDPLYKSVGCVFRASYENGILLHALTKRFDVKSVLEIGFGKGYGALCVAKTMVDLDNDGKIYSVDANFDENHLKGLASVFPQEWFRCINLVKGTINDALLHVKGPFDMVVINGNQQHDVFKYVWGCVEELFTKFAVFNSYEPGSGIRELIEQISLEKELVLGDRRIFVDDRRLSDDQIDYGQVLIKNPSFDTSAYLTEW